MKCHTCTYLMRSFDVGKLRMSILFVSSFRGVTCVESPAYMLDYKVESGRYFTKKNHISELPKIIALKNMI